MSGTYLEIKLDKIRENSRRISHICAQHGVEVLGVTKGFSAIPEIVTAMVEGGITKLADARLENIISLRERGFDQHMTLLRIPMLSRVEQVVRYADCSLNSEYTVIEALSEAALRAGKVHDIVLMIEVGDLREGVLPADAAELMRRVGALRGVNVSGVGTNMGCYGGILPTEHNLSVLCSVAEQLEAITGRKFEAVSGGGTSSLMLVQKGEMPAGVNQLRVGEGLLLGTDTTHSCDIPWLEQDAFVLRAEIVELKSKPSVPYGKLGRDAFGNVPEFEDNGVRRRAIIALGRQDVAPEGIVPIDGRIRILGASSDHMILDIEDASYHYRVGDRVGFHMKYQGMLSLCSSRYIRRRFV